MTGKGPNQSINRVLGRQTRRKNSKPAHAFLGTQQSASVHIVAGFIWRMSANVLMGLVVSAATLLVSGATAHEWYPRECCGNLDCAAVERVELLADGSKRLTSRIGTTVVPASFPRQASPDNQMHICMLRYSHLDGMRPTCLF